MLLNYYDTENGRNISNIDSRLINKDGIYDLWHTFQTYATENNLTFSNNGITISPNEFFKPIPRCIRNIVNSYLDIFYCDTTAMFTSKDPYIHVPEFNNEIKFMDTGFHKSFNGLSTKLLRAKSFNSSTLTYQYFTIFETIFNRIVFTLKDPRVMNFSKQTTNLCELLDHFNSINKRLKCHNTERAILMNRSTYENYLLHKNDFECSSVHSPSREQIQDVHFLLSIQHVANLYHESDIGGFSHPIYITDNKDIADNQIFISQDTPSHFQHQFSVKPVIGYFQQFTDNHLIYDLSPFNQFLEYGLLIRYNIG